MMRLSRRRKNTQYERREKDLNPDEVFIDSSNLPNFDTHQFEGRLEKTISRRSLFVLSIFIIFIFLIFTTKIWSLQINKGDSYFSKSENNRLRNSLIFSKRGIVYDRNGVELAWNVKNSEDKAFDLRQYTSLDGFSHLLGYLKYPSKDKYGFYFSEVFDGKAGVEKYYNDVLSGKNGRRIVEVNALDEIQSENIVRGPQDGDNITLAIEADIQNEMFEQIKSLANRVGFTGGAGVIIDVWTGEILTLTSYPEYSAQVLTDGKDTQTINKYITDKNKAFLNRTIDGLYTPGSTVKPFMAYAALQENIIDPLTNIYSSGALIFPNPYDPSKPTIFKDWKAHGYTDMRKALAVSSDVYFYQVGGGFENQKGLGILKIDKYMKMFGFGEPIVPTNVTSFFSGPSGVIPTPEWKEKNFAGDQWRVGNTYHTSIGQYGFQISPIQMVRAVGALANGGKLVEPKLLINEDVHLVDLKLDQKQLQVVKEGMRDSVNKEYGVARSLNNVNYEVAAKTGTAELGASKQFVNSWVTGFFPYDNPKYAFVVIMENGPADSTITSTSVIRQVLDYMVINKAEYLR